MRQIICMKWGTLYGSEYVNTLFSMVKRNLVGDFRFVCLTDNANGIREEVEVYDCPVVSLPQPYCLRGWRKVSLFAPSDQLFDLDGDWLYLDLDVVITGGLDEFFTYAPENSFVVMQNWTQPGKGIGNTSVYRFRVGADSYLLDDLLNKQDEILQKFRNSQTYISKSVRHTTFWPDDWCILFKTHCIPSWPQRFWKQPVLPSATRVVAFPGVPNPHQAVLGEWPAKSWKKIYKSILPAQWIKVYWKNDQ